MNPNTPITEADLHAFVDQQLSADRACEIEAYLATRPDEFERVQSYRAQKRELHALFDPVLDEPLPHRVLRAARPASRWLAGRIAAAIAIALVGGGIGWSLRGGVDPEVAGASAARLRLDAIATGQARGFAQRAAIAHAVYSPDVRRAVEVSAEHEDQLVTWLSKRMGTPMKAPHLQALGYALEGGRLLPGGQGPVAQFMYHDAAGARLTLYVSNEVAAADAGAKTASPGSASAARNADSAFRFAREGPVNVFYWVEGPFGYAISGAANRDELARVSAEVYRQFTAAR